MNQHVEEARSLTRHAGRAAALTITAAALGTVLLTSQPADADVPDWQHPRLDPTTSCFLIPDPGSSGDSLYPAGDDSFTVVSSTLADPLDVLANDCANSAPDVNRQFTYTQPVDALTGQISAGQVTADGGQRLMFLPAPNFVGTATFQYSWTESGTETAGAHQGRYAGRRSTLATVTISVTPPATSTPTDPPTSSQPSGPPSSGGLTPPASTSSSPTSGPASAAPSSSAPRPPALANTGTSSARTATGGLIVTALGIAAARFSRRREEPETDRDE